MKTYIATLRDVPPDSQLQPLRDGIELRDGSHCLPAEVRILGDRTVEIKICEGKYHQIKRMFAAAGNRVLELERTAMGGLPLDPDLEPGKCRELTAEELDRITAR